MKNKIWLLFATLIIIVFISWNGYQKYTDDNDEGVSNIPVNHKVIPMFNGLESSNFVIESLSKRYVEYHDSDNKLLYGIEYTLNFSLPERYKNEQKNYRIEIVLPQGVASIFGINMGEINQNDGFEIKQERAYFSIPFNIATSTLSVNQKEYLQKNNDNYTIKIYSKNNKVIKQEVIKAKTKLSIN